MIPALSGPSNSLFSDLRALGALGALCVLCVKSLSLLLPVNCELSTVNFLSGSNHENQKNQRRTSLETIRRPSRFPAAPVHHGPRRLFSSPPAQPSRRKGPPSRPRRPRLRQAPASSACTRQSAPPNGPPAPSPRKRLAESYRVHRPVMNQFPSSRQSGK